MHHGGGGMDHGGGDMGPMCSMNMIWNTQIIDTCIVFPAWRIKNNFDFVLSFFIIIGLGVLYEWLRLLTRKYDARIARSLIAERPVLSGRSSPAPRDEPLLGRNSPKYSPGPVPVPPVARTIRAVLYGLCVFLSFFLMLVFMTYNAYLILAVVLGAAAGHWVFNSHIDLSAAGGDAKGMACH